MIVTMPDRRSSRSEANGNLLPARVMPSETIFERSQNGSDENQRQYHSHHRRRLRHWTRGFAEALPRLGQPGHHRWTRRRKPSMRPPPPIPACKSLTVDMADPASIRVVRRAAGGSPSGAQCARQQCGHHAAGKLAGPVGRSRPTRKPSVATNLLGPIRLTAALLPPCYESSRARRS